jgi:hypothetical protein
VDNPHIIPVHAVDEVERVPVIVMRFVAGSDLRPVLEQQDAPPPERAAGFISRWPPPWMPRKLQAGSTGMSSRPTSWWTRSATVFLLSSCCPDR